ncbi:MAG: hypothetical protein HGB08_04940 [Candidatus Moranbacteria bacterium]|nr:hypothetical protein [Candidatus Moranbacteria bacterium]
MNILAENKELAISSAVIVFCIILGLAFPSGNIIEEITKNIFFFVILPVSYVKIVLKKNTSDFGFNMRNNTAGLRWGAISLAASLASFYLLVEFTPFEKNYGLSAYASGNFWFFVLYELAFVNLALFINEFFFRGFVLNIFLKKFGYLSIAIQSILYISLAIMTESSVWQIAPLAVLSVTGGITAYKTKSFLYSYFSGLLAIIILGAYLIHLAR